MQCVFEPYEGEQPYIFVSYSHKDGDRVAPILDRMHQEGYRIWYDEGIDWGTEWPAEIEKHLLASTVCLAFHSASSVESVNCRQEITFAIQHRKGILPIYLEQVTLKDGLEMQMTLYQAIHHWQYADQAKFFSRLFRSPLIQVCRDPERVIPAEVTPKGEKPKTENRTPAEPRMPVSSGAPVLMIGLGGTGSRCVERIKETMSRMMDDPGKRVRFLAVDTNRHDLLGLTHLEEDERFFIRMPNPTDPARQMWNDTFVEQICSRIGIAGVGMSRDVYVISGSGGNTGATMFLKMPTLQTLLGNHLRFSGVLIRPELFRAADQNRKAAMRRVDEQLLQGLERGEDRSANSDGYQRCWLVDAPQYTTLNDAIFRTAEILAHEAMEPQLVNCMEPIGFWTMNREQGLSVSRMGIARAAQNPDRVHRTCAGRLLRHIGLGGPGADGLDFLGKNNYPDQQQLEAQVDQLLAPVKQFFQQLDVMDDSYLDHLNSMNHADAVRYLVNGGEQELMRIQDRLINRALDTEGMTNLVRRVRTAEYTIRQNIWQLIQQEGLHHFLHLYHGVYRDGNGSLGYGGPGVKLVLRQLLEGHWRGFGLAGRKEQAEHWFMESRQELNGNGNAFHRMFHAHRLREMWTESFRKLGHARMHEAWFNALLHKDKLLDRYLVTRIDMLAADVERFAWILESLCEPNTDWERISVPGELVEPERIDPQMDEVVQEEIRRSVCMANPVRCRKYLLDSWIEDSRRWMEAPEETYLDWMTDNVYLPDFDLVWFFRERMNRGFAMNSTAHLVLQTLAERSTIHQNQWDEMDRDVAYLLIPRSLSCNEPSICHALMGASQNMGMHIQVITVETDSLCMIRGGMSRIYPQP